MDLSAILAVLTLNIMNLEKYKPGSFSPGQIGTETGWAICVSICGDESLVTKAMALCKVFFVRVSLSQFVFVIVFVFVVMHL